MGYDPLDTQFSLFLISQGESLNPIIEGLCDHHAEIILDSLLAAFTAGVHTGIDLSEGEGNL